MTRSHPPAASAAPTAAGYPDGLRPTSSGICRRCASSARRPRPRASRPRCATAAGRRQAHPPGAAMATAKATGEEPHTVLPLAAAIELIHTYSLIHDDLPAMDDDDLRRGRPTPRPVRRGRRDPGRRRALRGGVPSFPHRPGGPTDRILGAARESPPPRPASTAWSAVSSWISPTRRRPRTPSAPSTRSRPAA